MPTVAEEKAAVKLPAKPKSRPQRWADAHARAEVARDQIKELADGALGEALGDLRDLQAEYQEWRDSLPENLESSPIADKLDAILELELDAAAADPMNDWQSTDSVVEDCGAIDLPHEVATHPLSPNDYDDVAGHLSRLAKDDARVASFNNGIAFRILAFAAITEAIQLEWVERTACGKTLPVSYTSDLSPQDIERLAWRYLAALSMAKEAEVRS